MGVCEKVCNIFEAKGGEVYLVELEAELNERLKRNKSPDRLEQKPSKRNIAMSEKELLNGMKKNGLNSFEGEITRKNYIKINNTNLSPQEVAMIISERFQFNP